MRSILTGTLMITVLSAGLLACGGGKEKGKVGDLKAKIEKLKGEQKKTNDELSKLEAELEKLDAKVVIAHEGMVITL